MSVHFACYGGHANRKLSGNQPQVRKVMRYRAASLVALAVLGTLVMLVLFESSMFAQNSGTSGTVYIMSNKKVGNSVLVFRRSSNETLQMMQEVSTQGLGSGGTGDPLMSQGALTMSRDGHLLFAVNAGSGELTAFVVTSSGLEFGSKVSSNGAFPVSVTEYNGTVYVVNQLGISNLSGYTVDSSGRLTPIGGSSKDLPGAALGLPAEVQFGPNGKNLIVTEKGTDQVDVFPVNSDGTLGDASVQPSSGMRPFGFAFSPMGTLIVSEAEGGFPMRATVSSYALSDSQLAPISAKVSDGQTAACWVAITGQTAWVVNTGTATVSSYAIGPDGKLHLVKGAAASTGAGSVPTDVAASSDGTVIYVLESALGGVAGYRVSGGSLTPLFNKTGLPYTIAGIAAR